MFLGGLGGFNVPHWDLLGYPSSAYLSIVVVLELGVLQCFRFRIYTN